MKKTTQLFAGLLMLTGVLSACSPAGNEGFMRRVETDFRHKQELLPRDDLFGIFDEPMTRQEREAMMFLYAYIAGLIVGIIALFAYNYLVSRVDGVMNQLEAKTMEFMDLLNEPAE